MTSSACTHKTRTPRFLIAAVAASILASISAVAAPLPDTLWFSGDPVFSPNWSNQATTTPNALTIWQEFTVTDAAGWTVTDLFSIGEKFGSTNLEWSIRTGMGVGVAGTTIAGGTGAITGGGYGGKDIIDVSIAPLYLAQGNYWLEVAPTNGSISTSNGTNAVGTTPVNAASSLRDWPLFSQNYINVHVGSYSEGVAGVVGAVPESASVLSMLLGLGSLAFFKFRRAGRN